MVRRYKRAYHLRAAVTTIVGCIGWGLLGYLVMTTMDGLFWPGWIIMTAALCVGAYTLNRLVDLI